MNRYEGTNSPKNPPNTVLHPQVRSAALLGFVGSLVGFFVLVGVVLIFWTVAHPRPTLQRERARVITTSGDYSTEGGHDPIRRPSNTSGELKFRGTLTPPTEARGR